MEIMRFSNANYLLFGFSITLFIICFLFGYRTQSLNVEIIDYTPEYPNTHTQIIEKFNFQDIVYNNLNVIARLLFGGFILGVPTFITFTYNSLLIGIIVSAYNTKYTLYEISILILPHGIFEIPAIIIAGAAGFKIPYEIVRYLAGRKEQILTKDDITEYLTLALISTILIIVAAWIEANVTLKIAENMINSAKDIRSPK